MSKAPREAALVALFEAELRPGANASVPGGRAGRIVKGVREEQESLDAAISSVSTNWRLERMPPVDRVVLRIGLYELRHETSVPVAVILDEAVELAKRYSTDRSGAFINGVLAQLARVERAAEMT